MLDYMKRSWAFAVAALAALAMAFGLMLVGPNLVQAEEPLTAQAVPEITSYDGDSVKFLDDSGSEMGMWTDQGQENGSYYKYENDKIKIKIVTKNNTIYGGFLLNDSTSNYTNEKPSDVASKSNWYPVNSEGYPEFELDKSYCGKKIPVALIKNKGGSTSGEIYLAIPSLDKIPATYDLTVKNSEKMFVGVKATLTNNPSGDDELTFYLNGASYTYAYAGGQDEAVAAKDAKDTDKKWAKQGAQATFDEVTYVTYAGVEKKATQGYPYAMPIAVPSDAASFTQNVTVISDSKKTGGETVDNYHARAFAIDLNAKTLSIGNASDTAALTVKSEVADVAAAEKGTLEYKGYARPYAGTTLDDENPLSNDWVGALAINLGSNKVYDQAYVVNYEGKPWLAEDAKAIDPKDSDKVKVGDDGALSLAIVNEYDTDPKTTQLNGNIVKVKMHVASDAPYKEADTWVDRTFKLDFSNRTAATLAISGEALTPVVETQAMHRLYNPNSGEHFFTADDDERDNLVSLGWNNEGDAWNAPATSSTPVYRLYNPNAGEHHYTMSAEERDNLVSLGWNDENIGWYSDDAQSVPLYRVYNPNEFANNHHYTASVEERDWLVSLGWNDEDIAWYGLN